MAKSNNQKQKQEAKEKLQQQAIKYYEEVETQNLFSSTLDDYQKCRTDILKTYLTKVDKKKIEKIENYLNKLFYHPETEELKKTRQALVIKIEAYIRDKLGIPSGQKINFNFDANSYNSGKGIDVENNDLIGIAAQYEQFKHSVKISLDVIRRRADEIHKALNRISARDIEATQEQLQELRKGKKIAEDLLVETVKKYSDGKNKEWIDLAKNQKFFDETTRNFVSVSDLVADLDQIYEKLAFFEEIIPANALLGSIFERSLGFYSMINESSDKAIDAILNEVFSNKTAGEEYVSRGQAQVIEGLTKQGTGSQKQQIRSADGVLNISKFFENKQGKMDISFTLPRDFFKNNVNEQKILEKMRISAKNWSELGGGHGFGESDVAGILLRTLGIDSTYKIGLTELFQRQRNIKSGQIYNNYKNARTLLKLSVFLDIVMGYSQKHNSADFIVINNRAKSKISVYSVYQLYQKFKNNIVKEPVDKSSSILQFSYYAKNIFTNFEKINKENFTSSVIQELANYKLGISYTILN